MTHARSPLTKEQLDEARRRHKNRETMASIARSFNCKPDWLKCLVDPEFNARRCVARRTSAKKAREQRRAAAVASEQVPETDNQLMENKRSVTSDVAFIAAMQSAIQNGDETAPMIMRKAPCTDSPHFVPHRGDGMRSVTGSSAQSCADFA